MVSRPAWLLLAATAVVAAGVVVVSVSSRPGDGGGSTVLEESPHSPVDPEARSDSGLPTQPADEPNLLRREQQTMSSDDGWYAQGNTRVARDAGVAYEGDSSLRVTADPQGPWPDDTRTARVGTGYTPATAVPVRPGVTYQGSVRVRPQEPVDWARCELRWYGDDGGILATSLGARVEAPVGVWTALRCSATAPAEARYGGLRTFVAGVDVGQVFHIDDAWFVAHGARGEVDGGSDVGPDPEPSDGRAPIDPQAWPDAETTGVPDGVDLEPSGAVVTERDGQVIDGLEVDGTIEVRHSDVTIRNTRVLADGRYGIHVPRDQRYDVSGLVIEDVHIRGVGGDRSAGLAPFGDWTARRIRVSGFEDGVKISGQRLIDSWIEGDYHQPEGAHNDGIQSTAGRGAVIRGNRIEGPDGQTSAIIIQSNFGDVEDYVIEANLLSGGGFTLYIRDKDGGHGVPTGMVVRDNVFIEGSWTYGPHSIDRGPGFVWEGNLLDDGTPLELD